MRNFVLRLFVNAVALSVAAWLVEGVSLDGDFASVLIVALVFGVVNALLKPVLMILSLPFLLVTLGLFTLVINAALLMVTARLMDGLAVSGFGAAFVGSLVVSIVSLLAGGLVDDDED